MARSLLGKFCLDSKQNLASGRGILNLTKVLAQAEKYDCNCGESPNALSSKTRQPQPENSALEWLACQRNYALNRGLLSSRRGVRAIALSIIYYGAASKLALRRQFSCWEVRSRATDGAVARTSKSFNIKIDKLTTYVLATGDLLRTN
jgi:hypothetical protein